MAKKIEGTIYKLTYTATWHEFVECSSKQDLFEYIAKENAKGYGITAVNEIQKDGKTPRVKFLTNKDFKRVLSCYQKAKEHKEKYDI